MKIRVENSYEDGHESTRVEEIPDPLYTDADPEEGLRDFLWEFSGDGHGLGNDLGLWCEITILEAENESLIGQVVGFG